MSAVASQPKQALDHANRIKQRMVQERAAIRAMAPNEALATVADLLEHPFDRLGRMTAESLLCSIHGVGDARIEQWAAAAGIRCNREIVELTGRQRMALAAQLRRYAEVERRDRRA